MNFVPTLNVISKNNAQMLAMVKAPHSVSLPVIRKSDDGYQLASFVFTDNAKDLKKGYVERPTRWFTCDMTTGNRIETFFTKVNEFSDAPYNMKYLFIGQEITNSKEYYRTTCELLDEVRQELIETGELNKDKYDQYLQMVLRNTPISYQRFFKELSV